MTAHAERRERDRTIGYEACDRCSSKAVDFAGPDGPRACEAHRD